MSWNEGYVVDSGYTYGSFAELNPLRADLALNLLGYAGLPEGPCCELGFGQGMSINLSSAANPQRIWWGTDFNPEQVCFAKSLAQASGSGLQACRLQAEADAPEAWSPKPEAFVRRSDF